jgi:hypothetical protein
VTSELPYTSITFHITAADRKRNRIRQYSQQDILIFAETRASHMPGSISNALKVCTIQHFQERIVAKCNETTPQKKIISLSSICKNVYAFECIRMVEILSNFFCKKCAKTTVFPKVPDLRTFCILAATVTLENRTKSLQCHSRLLIHQMTSPLHGISSWWIILTWHKAILDELQIAPNRRVGWKGREVALKEMQAASTSWVGFDPLRRRSQASRFKLHGPSS